MAHIHTPAFEKSMSRNQPNHTNYQRVRGRGGSGGEGKRREKGGEGRKKQGLRCSLAAASRLGRSGALLSLLYFCALWVPSTYIMQTKTLINAQSNNTTILKDTQCVCLNKQ